LHIQSGEARKFFNSSTFEYFMTDYNNHEQEQVDALGQLLQDYFHHKDGFGITERNDGFIDPEDPKV
jgi:hypothetical protein